MDLRRKLDRLGAPGPTAPARLLPPDDDPAAARGARITHLRALPQSGPGPKDGDVRSGPGPNDSPGEVRETKHGVVHVLERWLEPHHCHGRVPVREALEVRGDVVARLALDPGLEGFDPRRMVLLDTETTGLAGGAGTLPFLIGMAWFEDESLRVQQLFLPRPGMEGPMLRVLADRIAGGACIVTYNGKAFDWPLLRTRFVMNRVPMPQPPPHLDLLACARRILKARLERVRLVHVEAELLGMHREDDVDGSDIPALYLDYLRGAGASTLLPVIEHNANDLVALAAILGRLCAHFETLRPEDDPRDHLAYARLAVRACDETRAAEFARAAAGGGGPAEITVDACLLLAWLARRRGDVGAERAALSDALEAAVAAPERLPEVHLALAKLHEHRLRDPEAALAHARRAVGAEEDGAHQRRVLRLERRISCT